MAFDFSTLVTDRTQQDVAYARQLAEKLVAGTATEEEKAEWNSFTLKGVYNHTDLNRVTTALEVLKVKLESYGYLVPGYEKVKIKHPTFGGGSNLPNDYIELEYIQSTGTQYIDTGFKPNQDTKVVMDVYSTPNDDHVLFSARTSASSKVLEMIWSKSGGYYRFYYNDGSTNMDEISVTPATRRTITVDKNVATIDGYSVSRPYSAFQCECNMVLFARNTVGTIGAYTTGKLYSCQVFDNGALIRDFVPCINPSGDVGLFDIVNQQFYGNAGTGAFVAGNRVGVSLPSGYIRLSHIESNGTQYVNTGINASVGTKAVLSFQATTTPTTNWWILSAVTSGTVLFRAGVNASTFRTDAGFIYSQTSSLTARTTANGVCTVNMSIPLYLFAQNESGAVEFGKFKLYACLLYNDGVLVRDYIPCLNDSGVAGLYDLVSESFFGNNGTGSFVTGAIPRELPEGYTQVEYIQSNAPNYTSGQRIDTKFVPNSNTRVVCDFQFTTTTSSFQALLGSRSSSANRFCLWLTNGGVFRSDYNASNLSFPSSLLVTEKHTLDFNKNVCSIDGSVVTHSVGTFNGVCNLFLFASDTDGSADIHGNVRIYSCHIYDNGTLVRDFVPCKNSGGVFGLYDIVNATFYQNAGSGAFAAGEEIVAPATASVTVVSDDVTEYDPYTWYEFDWPTPETMSRYLSNISVIRSVLSVIATTPNVPLDAYKLIVNEANDIEVILLDVYRQLTIMATTFIPCGEALCGGDNL